VVGDGEKMSKSLGNFIPLPDLLARYDARAYRLLVLQSHYRGPMTVADSTMSAATQTMERLDAFARRFASSSAPPDEGALQRFGSVMDADLDTPRAMAQLFELVTRANALADEGQAEAAAGLAAAVFEITAALGLRVGRPSADIDAAALALAAERDEARRQKDYGLADSIRDRLQAQGYVVEDTPEGTRIRR
jgi:cysteinyl-tRNA synthetase